MNEAPPTNPLHLRGRPAITFKLPRYGPDPSGQCHDGRHTRTRNDPIMNPNRWFMLRHPEGFDVREFELASVGWQVWCAVVRTELQFWEILHPDTPKPTYEFGSAELSADRALVKFALGGDPRYAGLKTYEDEFPADILRHIPLWFRLDLETGRMDELGWFPQPSWTRLHTTEEAEKLRNHPAFRRIST